MPTLTPQLRKILARTRLAILPEDYYMVRLPVDVKPIPGEWYRPATTRFGVFVRESDAITLIVPRRKWLRMQLLFDKYTVSKPMKVITFDVKLSLNVVGFIAAIGAVLAKEQISILPVSSFDRDHILVMKDQLPHAVKALRKFLQGAGKTRGR